MASKHIAQKANPSKALYYIFIQPALTTPRTARPQWITHTTTTAHLPPQTRALSTSNPLLNTGSTNKNKTRAPETRHPRNEEIKHKWIMLVDPQTDKLGAEPQPRWEVLQSLDLKTHRLEQVVPDKPGDRNFIPICKIVDKKASYEAEKRKKDNKKESGKVAAKARSVKTLELNWAIEGNDLAHRLEKVRGFLEEGRRVEVVLASKKRGKQASEQGCKDVLERIREVVGGVKGAREVRGMEGKVGGFATLVYQGKVPTAAKDAVVSKEESGL